MQWRSPIHPQSGGTMGASPALGVAQALCLFATLLLGSAAAAQNAQTPARSAAESTHAVSKRAFSVGGQLKIDAADATLGEILSDVAALTGVKIDVPDALNKERIPAVALGPGPAREVLAALLGDSRCDFVIQASDTDPNKIQNVVVMARDKRGSAAPERAASSLGASAALADPAPAPAPDAAAPPAEEANASNPQPDPPAPPPAAAPEGSMRQKLGMTDQYTFPKTSPVSPPAALNQETISQQLLQMYQQRVQTMPQNGTSANLGAK